MNNDSFSGSHKDLSKNKLAFEKSVPCAATNYRKPRAGRNVIPILSDSDVEFAKEFVEENKK